MLRQLRRHRPVRSDSEHLGRSVVHVVLRRQLPEAAAGEGPLGPDGQVPARPVDPVAEAMSGHPEPWRDLPAAQQPQWADPAALPAVLADLRAQPPLTLPSECDRLRTRLAEAARGQAFVLQGGDCAETFAGVSAEVIRGKLDTLAQMAVILTYATSIPVVTVGRIAGQYAKPRSKPTETRGSLTLPAYRGDAVNGPEFTGEARRPDPARLRLAYQASATTLNFLRGVTADADVDRWLAHSWRRDLVRHPPLGSRHDRLAREIDAALRFVRAWRLDAAHSAEFYTSHEALILDYESALVRQDPRSGEWYDSSGHMLWIGERTRQPDGAHIEFASTIRNAVGVKLGPTATPGLVRTLVDKLDPERRPGRL